MNDLTIENFTEKTGKRFRISKQQKQRIADGEITREQAFQEFLNAGGLSSMKTRLPEVPDSVYADTQLTIDNFAEKMKQATGVARRFRVSRDQNERIKNGSLTREGALAEVVASKLKS